MATTYVREYFHPGFVAKRMELGAVVGAAPKENVVREKPEAGDVIILLGGKTGRDGVGGATGSSKVQTVESVETAGAEVQKGNAIEERKIQRLFRNGDVTRLIKKSNDFGAGGVCVAIGELADGLEIDLDKVPLKYQGLNGTEIAISESQERMAVVVRPEDVDALVAECNKENIDAVVVATSTPDYPHPSTASIVLGKLGLKNAFAFDLAAACCGFMYALDVACNMIQSGRHKRIIVIGADKMSAITDYRDRATCPLFGDGAGAAVVSEVPEGYGIKGIDMGADGTGGPALCIPAGGTAVVANDQRVEEGLTFIHMDGPEVYKFAVKNDGTYCFKNL